MIRIFQLMEAVNNLLETTFTIYGFTMSWKALFMFVVIGTIVIDLLVLLVDSLRG